MTRLEELQIRDPFLLFDPDTDLYYLYGSTDPNIWSGAGIGFNCFHSHDLVTWSDPEPAFRPPAGFWSPGQYWAPEVHAYRGRWYMFATFADSHTRGTQVLFSHSPKGPFLPWSDGPVTPRKWACLDGTLFIDDEGLPWIIYCHEWIQIRDGAMYAQRLAEDLRTTIGPPMVLFNASDGPWATPVSSTEKDRYPAYITDGPALFRLSDQTLVMLWSGTGSGGYTMGIARSTSGRITGPWVQQPEPLWSNDGGHGMALRCPDGRILVTLHTPNNTPHERAIIRVATEADRTLRLSDQSLSVDISTGSVAMATSTH